MNQNQNQNRNNNNNQNRGNNPFNIEHPEREDVNILVRVNRDIFVPLEAFSSEFGMENQYYSLNSVKPLEESFFHILQSLIFPNSTLFQISSLISYIITILFIVTLCFGIDTTNRTQFLPAKLSIIDKLGSYNPSIMKKNFLQYYRLITFQFLHYNFEHVCFNILSLVSFCSLFEVIIKKYIFIIIFLLSGILGHITAGLTFEEKERSCGANAGISGLLGGICMLFIMNWEELIPIFGEMGRFLTIYLVSVFVFITFCYYNFSAYVNIFVQICGFIYGVLIYAVIAKPIRELQWKKNTKYFSIIAIVLFVSLSLVKIYLS